MKRVIRNVPDDVQHRLAALFAVYDSPVHSDWLLLNGQMRAEFLRRAGEVLDIVKHYADVVE